MTTQDFDAGGTNTMVDAPRLVVCFPRCHEAPTGRLADGWSFVTWGFTHDQAGGIHHCVGVSPASSSRDLLIRGHTHNRMVVDHSLFPVPPGGNSMAANSPRSIGGKAIYQEEHQLFVHCGHDARLERVRASLRRVQAANVNELPGTVSG